jgi:hypothetical protein
MPVFVFHGKDKGGMSTMVSWACRLELQVLPLFRLPFSLSFFALLLRVCRRNAVGDTLRATYDQLSRDPNSLANLDQDLPNYAQHQVPIFSLPQEWLWCESWCSDESKSTVS